MRLFLGKLPVLLHGVREVRTASMGCLRRTEGPLLTHHPASPEAIEYRQMSGEMFKSMIHFSHFF